MKRSQLEKYIKQAIKEAMHVDSQGNLQSDDDKIKRAGEDKEQLIYHKGGEIKSKAFFDDKINGRRVEGFWIGDESSWGAHGRQFYVWDPELARGGHVLGSFKINSNRGNLDSHVFVDQNHTKITPGKAKKIIEDIKKEVLKRISDGTLEETMSGVPTHADEFDDSSSQDDIGVNSGGDMGTHSGISQLEEDRKEKVQYNGETHEVMKREEDRIYIRRDEPSAVLGKLDTFWVKQGDLDKSNKEIVQYNGKAHTIEGGGADRYKIKPVDQSQPTPLNGEHPFWVMKDEVTKKTNEISTLESYVKKAIKEYMNGSPWSHGIAVGHKVNKYNDPELIKRRYDRGAAGGFQRRPKGRLSNPRGYALNEGLNPEIINKIIDNEIKIAKDEEFPDLNSRLKKLEKLRKITDPKKFKSQYKRITGATDHDLPPQLKSALNEGFSKEDWDDFIRNAANQPANDPKLFVKNAYDKGFDKDGIINALQQKGGHSLDDAETYYYNIVGQYEPVNESKDCNCGCGGCETPEPEHQSLRKYIQNYITESNLDWHQRVQEEYQQSIKDKETTEQEMEQAKQAWKADHTNDQLRYDYQDAIGKFKDAEKEVWMKQSMLPK